MRLILGDFCEENKQIQGRGRQEKNKKETIQTNIQSRTIGLHWERVINVAWDNQGSLQQEMVMLKNSRFGLISQRRGRLIFQCISIILEIVST